MNHDKQQSAYIATLQYLSRLNRPVSPNELVTTLKKSRVTVHCVLKRLLDNGWVVKEGTSPKVYYKVVDPFAKQKTALDASSIPKADPNSLVAFITWCKAHKYHVPEVVLEYQHTVTRK